MATFAAPPWYREFFHHPDPRLEAVGPENRFTEAALERHKREGMRLAVRVRLIACAIFAIMVPIIDPRPEALYFEGLILALALSGWAQLRVGRVGKSRLELLFILIDLLILTFAIVVPNPFETHAMPLAMEFRAEGFKYFYVLLAGATLTYSWRTLIGMGVWTTCLWAISVAAAWALSTDDPALTAAAISAFGAVPLMAEILDPNNFQFYIRTQEVVVFLVVSFTLAVTVRRYSHLLRDNAGLERERANLARYFSPNVVDELSNNDEPLKQIRTQDVAVLFCDIVGFTRFAADRSPEQVISTLRQFHQRMEAEVFSHGGTLDKYLGDGLMATFGTPTAHDVDAQNALACARAMLDAVADWNRERTAAGEPPIRVSVGLHYGPAVLGDIGANRLEFAVIGNTVNVASRIEALTRNLSTTLALTDDLHNRIAAQVGAQDAALAGLIRHEDLEIRGLQSRMAVWALAD